MGPSDTNRPTEVQCPKCLGSGYEYSLEVIPSAVERRLGLAPGEGPARVGRFCQNCGGQRMYPSPTGKTYLRADGTPCIHEYKATYTRNCYVVRECLHCPFTYDIDTSD